MILARSERGFVERIDNNVRKKFHCPLMFMKERFVYDNFPWIAPTLYLIDEEKMLIVTERGTPLREWLNTHPDKQEKKNIASQIIHLLEKLWNVGYIHGDVHMDNVVLFDKAGLWEVKLIDFEYLHHRRQEHFKDDIDMKGGGFVHCFDGSYRSIKNALGVKYSDFFK